MHCRDGRRTAMSCVKAERARSARFFSLKASSLFSFLTGSEFQNVFLATATTLGRCSSCYPCSAPQGRHQLTLAVTARKRTRPISNTGRCQPKCGSGCAPFQIVSVGLFHGSEAQRPGKRGLWAHHLPTQCLGFDSPGAPAPQVHGHLPGHGHDRFLPGGLGGLGIANDMPPFFDQLAVPLP